MPIYYILQPFWHDGNTLDDDWAFWKALTCMTGLSRVRIPWNRLYCDSCGDRRERQKDVLYVKERFQLLHKDQQ